MARGNGWSPTISGARLLAVLDAVEGPARAETRVPCTPPLSRTHRAIAALLALGHTKAEIAKRLGSTENTIRTHVLEAARRIPGNLPASSKLAVWYNGGTFEALGGHRGPVEKSSAVG